MLYVQLSSVPGDSICGIYHLFTVFMLENKQMEDIEYM